MSSSGYSLWFVLASGRTNHIAVCCVEPQALSLLSFSLSLSFFQVFICIQVRERAWSQAIEDAAKRRHVMSLIHD